MPDKHGHDGTIVGRKMVVICQVLQYHPGSDVSFRSIFFFDVAVRYSFTAFVFVVEIPWIYLVKTPALSQVKREMAMARLLVQM